MTGQSAGHSVLARFFFLATFLLAAAAGTAADSQLLVSKGQQAFGRGAFVQAATDWEAALESFQSHRNTNAEISVAVSLAGAYQALGQQRRAVETLRGALGLAESAVNPRMAALVKSKLGAALVMTREGDAAEPLLKEALASARSLKVPELTAAILNDLGNLATSQKKAEEALASYLESHALAGETGNSLLSAQALCNAASTAAATGQGARAETLNSEAIKAIGGLTNSHAKAFLLMTAGQTDRQIKHVEAEAARRLLLRSHSSTQAALTIADELDDHALQSHASGYLGQLYEADGQTDVALQLTRRAAFAAQQARLWEALYRWEWQTGRLLKARRDTDGAIAAYRRAVQTLQPIRNDVTAGHGNAITHLSFREGQGPLFFELADLLLQKAKSAADTQEQQQFLLEARDTVENLKAVELEDYFCDECVDVQRLKARPVEQVDKGSAVVYLIPLPDRTEIILGTTTGLRRFEASVTAAELTAQVRDFRRNLETRTTYAYLTQAQQLYDWFIRPIRGLLKEDKIDTLIFVPDGALRTVPFASLHDGSRFLIEDLAVAVVPGLSLVEPRPLERRNVRLLLNGLSKPVQGFEPLDFVNDELRSINQAYSSETLLNENFTLSGLQGKLQNEQYSVVHIASHGQFSRDVRDTFVLTYDNRLTLNELEMLIRPSQYRGRPVELLVLSACQTAAGDDRAALGLAGVALKAGARSALASLWFVNDQSTSALITGFYDQMRQSSQVSKARALQAAQIKLLNDRRYKHPCYWSPYLIIGNWL